VRDTPSPIGESSNTGVRCTRPATGSAMRVTGVGVSGATAGVSTASDQPSCSEAARPWSRSATDAISMKRGCGRCAPAWL
jgi:hypothetical protein